MDIIQLANAFAMSMDPDNEARQGAYKYLESIQSVPGLIPELLKLIASDQAFEIRQMGAIFLKNTVKIWNDSKRSFPIPGEDKVVLKANAIHYLRLSVPDKIRQQIEEVVHSIASVDIPWTDAYSQIQSSLDSGDIDQIYSGLSMTYQMSRVFEFAMSKKRISLDELVRHLHTRLESLFSTLLQEKNNEAFKFISLILQIYWVWIYIEVPEELVSPPQLSSWLAKLKAVVELDFDDEDEVSAKWVCKRWAIQTLHRFFFRYFNVNFLKESHRPIGIFYQENWAQPVMQALLPSLFKENPGIVATYSIKYTTQAVKFPPTSQMINTVASSLFKDVIMKHLKRVPLDESLWTDNPVEYIRRESDLGQSYFSPRAASIELLVALCENGHLSEFLVYASAQLQSSIPLLDKEALLLAIGSLHLTIRKDAMFASQMESLLQNYVFPEFDNRIGFLRARACWMYAHFASFPFTNTEHQFMVIQKICALTNDSELPVKVEAATTLSKLLIWANSQEQIGSEIKQMLQIYLNIMSQIDSEELVDALEMVICKFGEQIVPYALELAQYLRDAFLRMSKTDEKLDEGESAMAAVSTLNTLSKIVDAIEERPKDLSDISHVIQPILEYSLSYDGCEYFEEGVHLLASLLSYAPDDSLPDLFPLVRHIKIGLIGNKDFEPYAIDHLDESFPAIANFIAKYKSQTVSNLPVFSDLLFELLQSEHKEISMGCRIAVCMMENLQGSVDSLMLGLICKLTELIEVVPRKSIQLICMQTVCICLWYNPTLSLECIKQCGKTQVFFELCFSSFESLKKYMAKEYVLFGLGSLLTINEEIPISYSYVFSAVLKLTLASDQVIRNTPEKGEPEFEKLIERLQAVSKGAEDPGESDSDDSFFLNTDAEDLYQSALERKNKRVFVREIMMHMANTKPELYNSLLNSLEDTQKALVQEILNLFQPNN